MFHQILYINPRSKYVLQEVSPSSVDNINAIKINPYLDLNGRGVLIGMVDSGIEYLNEEFIREDDTSRIVSLWIRQYQILPTHQFILEEHLVMKKLLMQSKLIEIIKIHI